MHPITEVWHKEGLDQNFAHVKASVESNGAVYGLPVSYYHWGLYYQKLLIDKLGGPSATWDAFLTQCKKLKDTGVVPIGIGTKGNWPAAAWFDYIDLRINGLEFHQRLLVDKMPFTAPKVEQVLTEWKKLVDGKFYNPDPARIDWDEVLPYVFWDQTAYTLIGSFVSSKIPENMGNDIGFMSFPKMSNANFYEEAPMDIMLIPKKAKNIKHAETFIKFMARADV